MSQSYEIAIVGGGASGLAAAIFCAREKKSGHGIVLLEKGARVGKKLLATGNGTCNITNRQASSAHYHGEGAAHFVTPALTQFPPEACLDFFQSLGVLCAPREEGREYPLCQQAAAVLDCLRLELSRLGVTERCDAAVSAITKKQNGFSLLLPNGETLFAENVILCTGGAAAPSLGGCSDGYTLASALGHRKTPLFPSIVQVRTDTTFVKAMKGLRTDATVTFMQNGTALCSHTGELLFTEYGISGPAVMQISRAAGDWERRKQGQLTAEIDLLPTVSETALLALLSERRALHRTAADFLTGVLHKRIGQTVCRAAGFALDAPMDRLSANELHRLAAAIKHFTLAVVGTQGFGGAQVTAGGIATKDVDPHTMMSRLVRGLYLVGEVLDVDGDCGGYNLQWAWASAFAAAKAVCR